MSLLDHIPGQRSASLSTTRRPRGVRMVSNPAVRRIVVAKMTRLYRRAARLAALAAHDRRVADALARHLRVPASKEAA